MNKNLTEIILLLDRSGSMGTIKGDTIGGVNSFLEDQKKTDGKANVTLTFFSNTISTYVNGVDIQEVALLDDKSYIPGGGTALLDAIGYTINSIEDRYTNEEDSSKIPSKVIFGIITDGEENTSTRFKRAEIAKMIKHQTNRHGWEFVFLGANLDSVAEARNIGISSDRSFNFAATSGSVNDTFGTLSKSSTAYRAGGASAGFSYNVQGTSLESLNKEKMAIDNIKLTLSGNVVINGNAVK
jgi:uncharacterized protein YegL